MPSYRYVIKNNEGKNIHGILEAKVKQEVVDKLRQQNFTIILVEELKDSFLHKAKGGHKIKLDMLVVFSRQLATIVEAGITLVEGLDILSDQVEQAMFKQVILQKRIYGTNHIFRT